MVDNFWNLMEFAKGFHWKKMLKFQDDAVKAQSFLLRGHSDDHVELRTELISYHLVLFLHTSISYYCQTTHKLLAQKCAI